LIATLVWPRRLGAALLAALLLVAAQVPTRAAAPTPPVLPEAVPGPTIVPGQVSLSLGNLPGPYRVSRVGQTPYDASQPTGPSGLPEHLEVTFGPLRIAGLEPGDPILHILPVDAYRAQWETAGDAGW
jgi:hypothetical protein